MAVSIVHQFVNPQADGADTTVVRPTDWNATHTLSGLGTGVETALGVNVGSAGAVVTFNGALGTPSSGTLTNATGLPVGGISATGTPDNTTFLRGDGTWNTPTASATLNGISAATADQAGISNGDWNIVWNWQKTTNSEVAFTFGESAASTGGTSTSGVPNQVLLKLATLAASTMSPLSVYSRAAHVFSVSPTAAQILAANGSLSNPVYSFAGETDCGLYVSGTNEIVMATNGAVVTVWRSSGQFSIANNGTAGAPALNINDTNTGIYRIGTNHLGITCGAADIISFKKASTGGGWAIMDEADSNPTTTELDASDSVAFYNKGDKFVIAYNLAGTINYIAFTLDGSTTTFTNSTTAP